MPEFIAPGNDPVDYHSIPSLRFMQILFRVWVVIREKIHGQNVGFGFLNDLDIIRGRNEIYSEGNARGSKGWYGYAVQEALCKKARAVFPEATNAMVFGEWYGPGVHKGVNYGPKKRFVAIDIFINGLPLDDARLEQYAEQLGIEVAPKLFEGFLTEEIAEQLRSGKSALAVRNGAECETEGFVVRSVIPLYDNRGQRLIAKHKDERFEERAFSSPPTPREIDEDALEMATWFAGEYCTRNRLIHVLEKLRAADADISSMKGMGDVLRLMHLDIQAEAEAEHLELVDWKMAMKIVTQMTKEMYQQHMAEPII